MRLRTLNEHLWTGGGLLVATLVALPVVLVFFSLWQDDPYGTWPHLVDTVLIGYITNSVVLAVGATLIAAVVGVATAWLVTACDFPGRRWLELGMVLPLAVPTYVAAYCWTDLLAFAGPVQTWLRDITGWERGDYTFPDITSRWGAVLVFGSVLYPYVFLTARAAFMSQGLHLVEAARTLGMGPWRAFWRVSLPLARPAIAAGCALVAMESLADYGAVDYFGVDTFTKAIYRYGIEDYDFVTAGRLAAMLLVTVFVVLGIERLGRGGRRYHQLAGDRGHASRRRLRGLGALTAAACCTLPILIGAGIPLGVLIVRAWQVSGGEQFERLLEPAWTSLRLAITAGLVVVAASLAIAYAVRLRPSRTNRLTARIANLGYAVPGSVIAIAVLDPFAWFDNHVLDPALGTGLLLSSGSVILVFAYAVRFLAPSFGTIEAGLGGISPNLDDAARSLGRGPSWTLARVHLPLLRASIATAALVVMVDVLKELPATMILAGFNTTTLAVHVHQEVSNESLSGAALPALLIVAAGILPVTLLTIAIHRGRRTGASL